jgi:hypothetical protein
MIQAPGNHFKNSLMFQGQVGANRSGALYGVPLYGRVYSLIH